MHDPQVHLESTCWILNRVYNVHTRPIARPKPCLKIISISIHCRNKNKTKIRYGIRNESHVQRVNSFAEAVATKQTLAPPPYFFFAVIRIGAGKRELKF